MREVAGIKAWRRGTLALILSSEDTKTAMEDPIMWREVFSLSLFFFLPVSLIPYLSLPLFHQRRRLAKVEERGSHKSTVVSDFLYASESLLLRPSFLHVPEPRRDDVGYIYL
jgi:hypothetical protein